MKMILILIGIILVAVLYGWRFHPEAIGTKRAVFTRSAKDDMFAKWKPANLMDELSGERQYRDDWERRKARGN